MSGSLSRTDEMLVLLNRLANTPNEESDQILPQLGVTARRESFSNKRSPQDLQRFSIDIGGNSPLDDKPQVTMQLLWFTYRSKV